MSFRLQPFLLVTLDSEEVVILLFAISKIQFSISTMTVWCYSNGAGVGGVHQVRPTHVPADAAGHHPGLDGRSGELFDLWTLIFGLCNLRATCESRLDTYCACILKT